MSEAHRDETTSRPDVVSVRGAGGRSKDRSGDHLRNWRIDTLAARWERGGSIRIDLRDDFQ